MVEPEGWIDLTRPMEGSNRGGSMLERAPYEAYGVRCMLEHAGCDGWTRRVRGSHTARG